MAGLQGRIPERLIGFLIYQFQLFCLGMTTQSDVMENRFMLYLRLVRLDKPIGSLLLLWPTLCALWIASDGKPDWYLVLVFVLGTVLMRSAGCAINDFADRDFDRHVKRTADRPLTSGKLRPLEAVWVRLLIGVFVLFAGVVPELADCRFVRHCPCRGGHLSTVQALFCLASGLSRYRLRVRHSDGVCSGTK